VNGASVSTSQNIKPRGALRTLKFITVAAQAVTRPSLSCNAASNIDVDAPVLHIDAECANRDDGRQRQDCAGRNIEDRAMARTRDPNAIQLALIERPTIMGTDILDRMDPAVHVAEQNLDAIDDDGTRRSRRNVSDARDRCAAGQ